MNKEGKILGQHVKTITNTVGYAGSGTNVIGAQSDMNFVLYSAEKLFYRGASFYTNTSNAGAMRGYGLEKRRPVNFKPANTAGVSEWMQLFMTTDGLRLFRI